MSLVATKISP